MRVTTPGVGAAEPSVVISYAGRAIACRPGDTVAAALVDAGELACRELPDGSARGVFCGMGVCQECLVRVDGLPGQRACMTPVRAGMSVERQPARPTLQEPASEPVARERELSPALLVVGAGPAGLAAAAAAAESGLDVAIVDERAKLGGQYYKQPAAADIREAELDGQFRRGRRLIERVQAAGVTTLTGVQVWGAFGAHELAATGADVGWTLRPRRLVIATGAYERAAPLPGWTLPGVMTTGAAQTLLRAHQVAPGARILVSGNGPLNLQVAAELARSGATVVALCELAPITDPGRLGAAARMLVSAPDLARQGLGYQAALRRARVPVLTASAVIRCEGDRRVERATVARIGPDGHAVPGTERRLEVDAVCLGFGFEPSDELARALGCRHAIEPERHELVVQRGIHGRTSVGDVWVVGDAGGIGGARLAEAVGLLAGAEVARSLDATPPRALARELRGAERLRRRSARFQRALWRLYSAPRVVDQLADDATPICRCENVSRATIEAALEDDIAHIGTLKRMTRAGMGGCQGRYCGALLAEMTARRSGRELDELSGFAPSAPFKPVPIRALAGAERADVTASGSHARGREG